MRSIYLSIFLVLVFVSSAIAEDHNINIIGLTYSPATLNVNVGDNVTIKANATHPTIQVSETTWNDNGTTPMGSGWGTETTEFTFTVTSAGTIWYVCGNHVLDGMKAVINASVPTGTNESINKIGFKIYPNPSNTGQVQYTLSEKNFIQAKFELYDLSGKSVIAPQDVLESGTIEMNLASGTYIYRVSTTKGEVFASGELIIVAP